MIWLNHVNEIPKQPFAQRIKELPSFKPHFVKPFWVGFPWSIFEGGGVIWQQRISPLSQDFLVDFSPI